MPMPSRRRSSLKIAGNNRGTIFAQTIIAMFMMTMMAGYVFDLSSQDMRTIKNLDRGMQAQYLAEAGLNEALSVLTADFDDWNNAAAFPATALGNGTYDATVSRIGTRYLVSSVGTVAGTQRSATAEVTAPSTSALAYILAGGSTVDLRLTAWTIALISGSIYAAQNILLRSTAAFSSIVLFNPGDVYAGGTISNLGGNIVLGNLNPNWANVVGFPVFDYTQYQGIAQANGLYFNGDQTFAVANSIPANPPGGVIYVNGNITISAAQTTTACLIATGNITLTQGTVTINQFQNYPALMTVNGDITIRSVGAAAQGHLVARGLVYAGNNFALSGNHNWAVVVGSIIARGTLSESGTQCLLSMIYQAQNPPFMTSTGANGMTIRSYNA